MATAIEKAQAKIAALKQEREKEVLATATASPTPPQAKPIPKKHQLRFWAAYRDTELHHAGKNEPLK